MYKKKISKIVWYKYIRGTKSKEEVEIYQALHVRLEKLSQGVDFNIVIPIWKSIKKNRRIVFLKVGLDTSLQFGEISFHNIAPVLEKERLKISNLASFRR